MTNGFYGWVVTCADIAVLMAVLLFVPLAAFRKTRSFAGGGIIYCSYAVGFYLWVYSAIVTCLLLGGWAVVVGLLFFGVGVFPLAIIGAVIHQEWWVCFNLVITFVVLMAARWWGLHLREDNPLDNFRS